MNSTDDFDVCGVWIIIIKHNNYDTLFYLFTGNAPEQSVCSEEDKKHMDKILNTPYVGGKEADAFFADFYFVREGCLEQLEVQEKPEREKRIRELRENIEKKELQYNQLLNMDAHLKDEIRKIEEARECRELYRQNKELKEISKKKLRELLDAQQTLEDRTKKLQELEVS